MSRAVLPFGSGSLCNEALAKPLATDERTSMIAAATKKVEELFDILQVAYRIDHNTRETPKRVARMLVDELLRGRYEAPPSITEFDNVTCYDQLIVTGPIEVRSTCAHHLMPIVGEAFIGVLPSPTGKIIGLSKYDRIVDYFAARLQIQEEFVRQIGDFILKATEPRGLAIRVSAIHMCKTHRGVKATLDSRMISSAFYGAFLDDPTLKQEFLFECAALVREPGTTRSDAVIRSA
jgi:GTP cyclohydrolase IA